MSESGALSGLVILVVEDHDDFRETLRAFLFQAGAKVETAANGFEALDLLETGIRPDVIVSDIHMPRMDGCELVTVLRRGSFARVPVIALTGQASDVAILRTLEAGFDAHLVKPVSGDVLTSQVLRVLGRV